MKFFEFLDGRKKFDYQEYLEAFAKLESHIETLKITNLPKFMNTPNDFLQFLFDLNVICYVEWTEERKSFIHWCFKDRTYGNISPQVKSGVEYQVFYGLLKSLNLGKNFVS